MKLVLSLIFVFVVFGMRSERLNRWSFAGMTMAIALLLLVTYARF
ncbi:MAG: hypothetical protein WCL16_07595 [bacterium]